MANNCYILYSCDGSYDPIISNEQTLSGYTSSFVGIDIVDDPTVTPETCFYVLDIGEVECDITYNIQINTGKTCNCLCYCYFIRSASETTDVTYVNCNNDVVVETIQQGVTYNICSKIAPQFDIQTQIPIKITDICQDGKCPSTIPTVKPPNECDVITIFPMGVECVVQQPSSNTSFDGAAALVITGGTPPYTIHWEIGSFAPALTNIGVGEYSATVTDYYNDFTANTTCVLTAETTNYSGMCFVVTGVVEDQVVYISAESLGLKNGKPYYSLQYGIQLLGYVFWSQSNNEWFFCETLDCQGTPYSTIDNDSYMYPTGSTNSWIINVNSPYYIQESYLGPCNIPVIPKDEYQLCVTLTIRSSKLGFLYDTQQIQLDTASVINGETSWTSSTGQYLIYWNTGSTPNQWVMTGYSPTVSFINNDPSYPPLSNWQVLGSPEVTNMEVNQGECVTAYTLSVSTTVNEALCGGNGSIIVQAIGGVAPYQYSVNGGVSYQPSPIFNNLTPGYYYVFVKDSNDVIGSLPVIQIQNNPPTSYQLTLSVNYVGNTFTITAPTLPPGVTLSADLVMTSLFSYYPNTIVSPLPQYNNITTINGTYPMTLTNVSTNVIGLTGPCTADGAINILQTSKTYTNTLTFTSGQVITGSTTNSIINAPTGICEDATGSYQLTLTNGSVSNCGCCVVNVVSPIPAITPKNA